jgi:hypothetical protein
VHLEASTKPHVHRKFEIFWTNIASTMTYPNFKNGPKIGLLPLGVKEKKFPERFLIGGPSPTLIPEYYAAANIYISVKHHKESPGVLQSTLFKHNCCKTTRRRRRRHSESNGPRPDVRTSQTATTRPSVNDPSLRQRPSFRPRSDRTRRRYSCSSPSPTVPDSRA